MVPALVALSFGNTEYQAAYPPADATAPEVTAASTPVALTWASGSATAARTNPNGVARRKLSAFWRSGASAFRPRSEYNPQAIPATAIRPAPSGSGRASPGRLR